MPRKKKFEESEDDENDDYSDQDRSPNSDEDDEDDDDNEDDDNVFAPENDTLTKEQKPQESLEIGEIAPVCQERLGPARKPLNAFSFFKTEQFDATRNANPSLTMMEVIDLIGQKWGELNSSKRAEYQQRFEQQKNVIVQPVKSAKASTSGKMIIEDEKISDSAKVQGFKQDGATGINAFFS